MNITCRLGVPVSYAFVSSYSYFRILKKVRKNHLDSDNACPTFLFGAFHFNQCLGCGCASSNEELLRRSRYRTSFTLASFASAPLQGVIQMYFPLLRHVFWPSSRKWPLFQSCSILRLNSTPLFSFLSPQLIACQPYLQMKYCERRLAIEKKQMGRY